MKIMQVVLRFRFDQTQVDFGNENSKSTVPNVEIQIKQYLKRILKAKRAEDRSSVLPFILCDCQCFISD